MESYQQKKIPQDLVKTYVFRLYIELYGYKLGSFDVVSVRVVAGKLKNIVWTLNIYFTISFLTVKISRLVTSAVPSSGFMVVYSFCRSYKEPAAAFKPESVVILEQDFDDRIFKVRNFSFFLFLRFPTFTSCDSVISSLMAAVSLLAVGSIGSLVPMFNLLEIFSIPERLRLGDLVPSCMLPTCGVTAVRYHVGAEFESVYHPESFIVGYFLSKIQVSFVIH